MELLLTKDINKNNKQFVFLKDCLWFLKKIGEEPTVETKSIIFKEDNVYAFLLMFRFNDSDDLIYTKWLNYNCLYDKTKLERLMFDKSISFCTIDTSNKKYSTFEIPNQLVFSVMNYKKNSKKTYWDEYSFLKLIKKINTTYNNRVTLFYENKFIIE